MTALNFSRKMSKSIQAPKSQNPVCSCVLLLVQCLWHLFVLQFPQLLCPTSRRPRPACSRSRIPPLKQKKRCCGIKQRSSNRFGYLFANIILLVSSYDCFITAPSNSRLSGLCSQVEFVQYEQAQQEQLRLEIARLEVCNGRCLMHRHHVACMLFAYPAGDYADS